VHSSWVALTAREAGIRSIHAARITVDNHKQRAGGRTGAAAKVREAERALPSQTSATLAAVGPGSGVPAGAELGRLFEETAQIIAACDQVGNSLSQAA
jgi:hypothetical protein